MKSLFVALILTFSNAWAASRPDQAFSFKENTCVCRNDKPVSKGDCANVCRGRNTNGVDVLFADFSVSSVLANSKLRNAKNWCYKYLLGDSAFPKCVLEAIDEYGNKTYLSEFSFPKDNSFTADLSSLEDDRLYWFRLVETTSGAKSIPYDVYIFDPVGVPLKTSGASQYACYSRASTAKSHFYFPGLYRPSAVPANSDYICHDVTVNGPQDSELFARLEEMPGALKLWNQSNFLFFDNNGDGMLDVNEYYMKRVRDYNGSTKSDLRLFGLLSSGGSREYNASAGNQAYDRLGFVMSYWVRNSSFASFCPSEADYATGRPEFLAMKDLLGVGTEGVYIADRSENEVKDFLFVRESDVKAVWYYLKDGRPTKPTEQNVQFNTIYFNYPFNKENPYVKGPNQKTYKLRSVQEIGNLTTLQAFLGDTGEMITYPSHDRKLGCVPKLSR